MPTSKSVLIIDDDRAFCQNVTTFFARHAVACQSLHDPRQILSRNLSTVALILLDINMPGLDGLTVLPLLKARSDTPVIMVSGVSDLNVKLAALRAGAEFHFTKPVSLDELFLVCARRLSLVVSPSDTPPGPWVLDARTHRLTSPEGTSIGLTMTETRLLSLLLQDAPKETDRLALVEILTGSRQEDPRAIRSLEVILSRLRTRFRHAGETLPIKATRNIGYIFLGEASVMA